MVDFFFFLRLTHEQCDTFCQTEQFWFKQNQILGLSLIMINNSHTYTLLSGASRVARTSDL